MLKTTWNLGGENDMNFSLKNGFSTLKTVFRPFLGWFSCFENRSTMEIALLGWFPTCEKHAFSRVIGDFVHDIGSNFVSVKLLVKGISVKLGLKNGFSTFFDPKMVFFIDLRFELQWKSPCWADLRGWF